MLGAGGGWGRASHRNSPLKCPDLSEPCQFSKTLPALKPWSVPWQAKVWGLDSLPVLQWSTPHPGHQMASRNKKKWLHFQPRLKCPSQPTNYYERFLKETLRIVFQSGLRDFAQFSKEGKLQPRVAGRAYFKLTRINCLLFIETASPYIWIY